MDLSSLPSDTSPSSVHAHIATLQTNVSEQLMDIENIKTANSHLQRKIQNIAQQVDEAHAALEEKVKAYKALGLEVAQEEKVVQEFKASSDGFVSI